MLPYPFRTRHSASFAGTVGFRALQHKGCPITKDSLLIVIQLDRCLGSIQVSHGTVVSKLTLGVGRGLAGALETWLLAFLNTGVARQQTLSA